MILPRDVPRLPRMFANSTASLAGLSMLMRDSAAPAAPYFRPPAAIRVQSCLEIEARNRRACAPLARGPVAGRMPGTHTVRTALHGSHPDRPIHITERTPSRRPAGAQGLKRLLTIDEEGYQ